MSLLSLTLNLSDTMSHAVHGLCMVTIRRRRVLKTSSPHSCAKQQVMQGTLYMHVYCRAVLVDLHIYTWNTSA